MRTLPLLDELSWVVELILDEGDVKYLMRRSRSMGVSVLERLTASMRDAVNSSMLGWLSEMTGWW